MNATTNEPVPKARVLVAQEGTGVGANPIYPILPVIADASGHFVITGLGPGQYRFEAHADHFVTEAYGARRPQAPGRLVEVGPGDHISDLNFRIFPCGAITGTIRDENGKPVAAATVRALSLRDSRYFQPAGTNRQGEYRISDLDPGPYILQVSYPDPGESEKPHLLPGGAESIEQPPDTSEGVKRPMSRKLYVCTYYPNTTDPGTAGIFTVQPGTVLPNIDVELDPVNTMRVSGRLMNGLTGKPAPSGWVGLNPRTDGSALPAGEAANLAIMLCGNITVEVKDPSGKFEFPSVPAGSYWAEGQISDNDRPLTGRVPVEVGDTDVDGVMLTASDGAELKGQVRVEPGAPFDFSRLSISLGPVDLPVPELSVQPKADGTFAREALPLREDDKPVPATVYVVPEPLRLNRPDLYFSTSTNGDGTFTLTGIPPGSYKVFGLRDADPHLTSNPALFQPYEAKGESVSIEDGSSQSVQLELITGADEE